MALAKTYDRNFEFFFWGPYPKKVGKPAAEKEFLKLGFTEDQMRELREHIELRKRTDKKWLPNEKGVTFIVDPERFLKHRRFEDEYERVRAAPVVKRNYDVEPEPEKQGTRTEAVARKAFEQLNGLLH